ncbi:MAG: MCE family protein [Planctomycetes bacterium]|nr:MCE family protein [Planctomycetota bacterium]MCB9889750.1 MCE family protein [Planctomycetota bacterium]
MNKLKRDTLLGLVFFAGLALLLWATQELSGFSLSPKQLVRVTIDNARGLRLGEPVFVLGTQNGKVHTVRLDGTAVPNRRVQITLELETRVQLTDKTTIEIVDSSFLGGKKVEVELGQGNAVGDDHEFAGTARADPLEALRDVVSGEGNRDNLQQILAGVRKFVDNLNQSKGTLSRLIGEDKLYQDAEAFVASLRKSAEELEQKRGLLGRVIYDQDLGKQLEKIASDLGKVTTKLTTTEGTIGRLINDDGLGKRVDKIVADAEKVTAQLTGRESTLGRLINDEKMGANLDKIVADVEKVTASLNRKDSGLLGALINDGSLLADARQLFKDLADITGKISSGKGTLGRLISDEDMGRRLDSMMRQITRAIEDAREAAPIGTFFQVFSGAF